MWSTREARMRLGLSVGEFGALIRDGKIKPELRKGRKIYFSEEEIERHDAILEGTPKDGLNMLLPDLGRRSRRMFYTRDQVEKWLGIERSSDNINLYIRPTAILGSDALFSHYALEKTFQWYRAIGYFRREIAFMMGLKIDSISAILIKNGLMPIGLRSGILVYDSEEVHEMMKKKGREDTNLRLIRVDGSAGWNDKMWFVIRIDRENNKIEVLSEELRTYPEGSEELYSYLSPF